MASTHRPAPPPGVYGSNAYGGNAVRAEVPADATNNAIAMYALNYSSYTGGGPGAGGFAIYGLSAKGHGLVGATAAVGAAAVVGATNGVAGAYAAAFYGPVIVGGDFTVVGGPRVPRWRIPTVHIVGSTAWRVRRIGSRISVAGRWSAVKRWSRSIVISLRSWMHRTTTSSSQPAIPIRT
jgi:hypothetical protein